VTLDLDAPGLCSCCHPGEGGDPDRVVRDIDPRFTFRSIKVNRIVLAVRRWCGVWVPAFAGMTAVVCVLSISGCATPSHIESRPHEAQTPVSAKTAENFTVIGRFAAKRGEQQGNGGFRYEQHGAARTLDIFSPTATQLARIEANGVGAKATLSDGTVREAATLSELLRQFIDIPISDEQFASWLQALPRDRSIAPANGSDGKIESFRESGWTIVVSGRFEGDAGFVRRMRWTFDAGDAAQAAEVRWVFDEFSTR
jgi:outer membrane biogenesis lipoprotein LolB